MEHSIPKTSQGRFKVRRGYAQLTIWRCAKGWRFGYRDGGRWRYITRKRKPDIIEAAERILEEAETGVLFSVLPAETQAFLSRVLKLAPLHSDRKAVLEFLSLLKSHQNPTNQSADAAS